jgi:hypothetical protein
MRAFYRFRRVPVKGEKKSDSAGEPNAAGAFRSSEDLTRVAKEVSHSQLEP